MNPHIEIMLIGSVVAIACALVGSYLVLRRMSLMSDAISHAILLGIVVGFFLAEDITSPILILGAALTGILTVFLTEAVINTQKMKEDASIGFVFPVLFSIGVILITKFASNVHLDTDAVLLGEIAFAPFNRFIINGLDIGPKALWVMGIILLLNLLLLGLFYKELKIATFDKSLGATLGFSPLLLHYGLMSMVSVTAVGAFDSVGSILVVALMIAPAAAAFLLTHSLPRMIVLSCIIGVLSAITGYGLALVFDASIAGSMAMMCGVFFVLALLFSPNRGLIAQAIAHNKKKVTFGMHMLVVHLLDHEGTAEEKTENTIRNARTHMSWNETFAQKVIKRSLSEEVIERKDRLYLTQKGRTLAQRVMTQ